jgi:hypothetical protein
VFANSLHPLSRILSWTFSLAGVALVGQQQSLPTPLAVVECQVPDMDTFVVHGAVPLPPGITFDPVNCPFSLYLGSTRLLTQWEPIAYRADGSLRTVEMLGVVPRGSLVVGTRQRFLLRYAPSTDPDLSFVAGGAFASQMLLRTKDVYGNRYEAALTSPTQYRLGAAQVTVEYQARLVPVQVIAGTPTPQHGAAQVWFSARAGTGVYEVVVNWHNGSSQHPTWHLYFKSLELLFPDTHQPVSAHAETMAGATYVEGSRVVLPLIREIPGKMQFLEQRHEREFRYLLHPTAAPGATHAAVLAQRIGWANALDVQTNPVTQARSWSFVHSSTPGYFPQAMPMPTLGHVANPSGTVSWQKTTLAGEIQFVDGLGQSISVGELIPTDIGLLLPSCFRNPFGPTYGGMASALNINPYEGVETLWTGDEDGILLAQIVARCYQDRQPGAIYEDDGRSFSPVDAQYLNANGSQPYALFDNVFLAQWLAPGGTADAPWEWDQADKSHEQRVEALGMVPPYRDLLLGWAPIDSQHQFRISRSWKMLVYLDNDPLARRRLEAHCQLQRATFFDGNGGVLSGFLAGTANIGGNFDREHAEGADAAVAAYAVGDAAWRTQWRPWFDTLHAVLMHLQTPGGFWQASTGGFATQAPFHGNFRVLKPRSHMFTMHALRGVKESVYANGVDALRYARANAMLIAAGEAIWRLLWRWHQDLSGPDGTGTWERVAVGPNGTVTPAQMYTDHSDHPPEQFDSVIEHDPHHTGLGVGCWFAEAPSVTTEMTSALQTFWSSTNVLAAALAQGVTNIWNNAPLIAWIQKHY